MTTCLISISFLISALCPTVLFSQTNENRIVEQSKGTWALPLAKFFKVIDNKERIREHSYSRADSSLKFITDSSYNVTAVFPGKVKAIFPIDNTYHLMAQFGNYFMTYSNITKPSLKVGDTIQRGQVIGKVLRDTSNEYFLTFILNKDTKEIGAINWFKW